MASMTGRSTGGGVLGQGSRNGKKEEKISIYHYSHLLCEWGSNEIRKRKIREKKG